MRVIGHEDEAFEVPHYGTCSLTGLALALHSLTLPFRQRFQWRNHWRVVLRFISFSDMNSSYRSFLQTVAATLMLMLAFSSFFCVEPEPEPADARKIITASSDHEKVDLSVYYDSLCPRCAKFFVKELVGLFENGLISITNLRLVPWGNAHVNNSTVACQNGEVECQLNTIEVCAINTFSTVDKTYGLIYCIELLALEGRQRLWESCFESLGLPKKKVLDCYNSSKGAKFGLAYANEAAHLTPPHTFLPWVVVNNQPIRKDYKNFQGYICRAYKGKYVPANCKQPL